MREAVGEISLTNIKGPDRDMARYRIQCTGASFSGQLRREASHLVVQPPLVASEKTVAAEMCVRGGGKCPVGAR
jgi:hypothetical protein